MKERPIGHLWSTPSSIQKYAKYSRLELHAQTDTTISTIKFYSLQAILEDLDWVLTDARETFAKNNSIIQEEDR